MVERYLAAFEAADVPGLTRLLADDVVLEMPPVALWLAGRAHYRRVHGAGLRHARAGLAPAARAGQRESRPGRLRAGPGHRRSPAHSLHVFTVTGGLIRRCVTFADPAVFDLFALPHYESSA